MRGRAVVIGAGFGGLAAALRLRARGHDVTLVDNQDQIGGRATVHRRNGFTFDAGPTVITAPFLFDELFDLFGRRREDYFDLVPLDPWYRIRFSDGQRFDYGGDLEAMKHEIARFEPRDVEGYERLLEKTAKIYDVGFERLGDQPFHRLKTMLGIVPDMMKLDSFRSVYGHTSRYIRNEHLRQVFSFSPLLVGGNPFSTTSIYSLIHFLERAHGVHFAMGGTAAIVEGLGRLLDEVGVETRLGEPVEQIVTQGRRARGVRIADGDEIEADIVVSNADPGHVYRNMLPGVSRRRWPDVRLDRTKYSMGLFVLYFGTTKRYPDLAHHEIHLGPRYRGLLDDIFDRKHLAEDFSLYLHVPTRTDPSLAPEGCESMYALVPVPNLRGGHDWSEIGPRFRDRVVETMEQTYLPGLSSHITEDFYVTPEHFRANLLSPHGAGFSIEPTLTQSAWFRFHNKSEEVDGLYFVGAGSHPGAGLPGVLTSARVLERVLDDDVDVRSTRRGSGSNGAQRRVLDEHAEKTPDQVMADHAKTFTWAARFLGDDVRSELAELYAFCRFVDDVVDRVQPRAQARALLARVRVDLERGESDLPAVARFLDLARRHGLSMDTPLELIDGMEQDLGRVRMGTVDELVRYCYRVASTVGLMMCELLGVEHMDEARPFAIDLGIAMQLTNICRDVVEDFGEGRIYLPAELVDARWVDRAVQGDRDARDRTRDAVVELLSLAERYYRSADQGMAYLPGAARAAILVASRNYEAIGERILQKGPQAWSERAATSRWEKVRHTVRALGQLALDPRYASVREPRRHARELHAALSDAAAMRETA
jgi:phytoene desaturase